MMSPGPKQPAPIGAASFFSDEIGQGKAIVDLAKDSAHSPADGGASVTSMPATTRGPDDLARLRRVGRKIALTNRADRVFEDVHLEQSSTAVHEGLDPAAAPSGTLELADGQPILWLPYEPGSENGISEVDLEAKVWAAGKLAAARHRSCPAICPELHKPVTTAGSFRLVENLTGLSYPASVVE